MLFCKHCHIIQYMSLITRGTADDCIVSNQNSDERYTFCLFTDIWGFSSDCVNCTALHLYVTYTKDMMEEVNVFMSEVVPDIRLAVQGDGHYLNVVNFPHSNNLQVLVVAISMIL